MESSLAGSSQNKANLAQLGLEFGLSLAIFAEFNVIDVRPIIVIENVAPCLSKEPIYYQSIAPSRVSRRACFKSRISISKQYLNH